MLLNLRLRQLGLRPVDVGDGGDCFFRAVSHQLYGDPSHHLFIRQAGVQYLSNNPARFIESNTENANARQRCTVWLKKGCKTARRTGPFGCTW